MKSVERKSLWHHVVFSAVLCAVMIAIIIVRKDMPSILLALFLASYIGGNTYLHYRRKNFHTETVLEYILISAAAFIVLAGALSI